MSGHDRCHETVPPGVRTDMLEEYRNQCQGCGRCGPGAGGLATLHVHHITRDPDDMDEHDPANLTVLCRRCHSLLHQQTTTDDVPVEITEEDLTVLLPQDLEILQLLAESGPARTGDIASSLSMELTVTAVRERLWVLVGLDNMVASRDRQIVGQDADTGEWGVVGQLTNPVRGQIPTDPQTMLQRIQDEIVRQALDRGCDRDEIMAVLGIARRTTFYREKRACAFDFPLDAIDQRNGGRPTVDDAKDEGDATEPAERPDTTGDAQQRLDTVADGSERDEATPADAVEQPAGESVGDRAHRESHAASEQDEIREAVQAAIAALQSLDDTL